MLLKNGDYTLTETINQTKILTLDSTQCFVWVHADEIGEILVASHTAQKTDHLLAAGKYRLYEVSNEPKITDLIHLELLVGEGKWQGYLLPTGLPNDTHKRKRIIPTREIITKTTHHTPPRSSSSSISML